MRTWAECGDKVKEVPSVNCEGFIGEDGRRRAQSNSQGPTMLFETNEALDTKTK